MDLKAFWGRNKRRLIILGIAALAFPFVLRVVIMGKLAYDAGSGDLWDIWACDAEYLREGRTNIERAGCVVPMPSVGVRQALLTPPSAPALADVHTFTRGAQAHTPDAQGYDPLALPDEGPPHAVTLTPFALQRFAVSVRQFRWCITYGPCDADDVGQGADFTFTPMSIYDAMMVIREGDDLPITGITWEGAKTYCEWVGGRLPTEAEWEFSARGGALQRRYPWGDSAPSCQSANVSAVDGVSCGVSGPASAALDAPAGRDELGMLVGQGGNVLEWTSDWYGEDAYARAASTDPRGPASGTERVLRGASWMSDDARDLRSAARHKLAPDTKHPGVGVRCATRRVDQDPVAMIDEFEGHSANDWSVAGGAFAERFAVSKGIVTALDAEGPRALWREEPKVSDTQISVRLFPQLAADGSVALLYGVQGPDSHYRAELFPQAGVARLLRVIEGEEGVISEASGLAIPQDDWMTLNLKWKEGEHVLSLGQERLVAGREMHYREGGVGLHVDGRGTATFDAIFTSPSEHAIFANRYAQPTQRDAKFYEGPAAR